MSTKQRIFRVYARWSRECWLYHYVELCPFCHKRHYHGGGDGLLPDMEVGQTGVWGEHCIGSSRDIRLRLVQIVPRGA